MTGPPNNVFVYGTLMPGELRWDEIEPFVTASERSLATGLLFDSGAGYPAARFDATGSLDRHVVGVTLSIDGDIFDECLELLDSIEATDRALFCRVLIETDGGLCWAYQYGMGLDQLRPIHSGSWALHRGTPRGEGSDDGPLLDFVEARVLGALIEKSLATPQNYPLSLNSITAACNQTSSREPLTAFTDKEVMACLTAAKDRKLVRFVHPRSGHGVTKYRHVLDELLGLDEAQVCLIGLLLLRGPQTPRELRDRSSRMHAFDSTEAVGSTLNVLSDLGLTQELERSPGQRDERWQELLTRDSAS